MSEEPGSAEASAKEPIVLRDGKDFYTQDWDEIAPDIDFSTLPWDEILKDSTPIPPGPESD